MCRHCRCAPLDSEATLRLEFHLKDQSFRAVKQEESAVADESNGLLSRREALRRGAVGTGVLIGSSWLVACGDDGPSSGGGGGGASADIGRPITSGTLAPFNPNAPAGARPDLPAVIADAMDNDREHAQAVRNGIAAGAEARGVELITANADGDSAKNIAQLEQFLARGVGALVINPIDAAAQAPVMRRALERGIAVLSIVTPPATMMVNADQTLVGKTLGDRAANHIRTVLGGRANVVILNQDTVEAVRPRFVAIREAVRAAGGTIVADIEPRTTDKEAAFATMSTILQKNPKIDVVLGADAVSLGALAAIEAEDKARPDMFIGGIDGEPEALAAIEKPNSPYKASVAFGEPIFAFPFGFYTAEWLAGRSIPQGVEVKALALDSPAAIASFKADIADPKAVWDDPARRDKYVALYGNISWETRGRYLDYIWTP
ncbi:MAG TPA: sugar ABC transporter substrate-binding protein [Conexibacter sp.]